MNIGLNIGYFATFAIGLMSGYILFRLQDRRQTQRTLSSSVYVPLHEDLHTGLRWIRNAEAFQGYSNWNNARASGHVLLMDAKLLALLETLFERTLPEYANAWFAAKDWVDRIVREWGRQFGKPALSGVNIENINWLNLLAQPLFAVELAAVRPKTQVSLIEGYWHPGTSSFEEFATERWQDAFDRPELSRFRNAREAAISEITVALAKLGKKIRQTL